MVKLKRVFLLTGGNLGNRLENLLQANQLIEKTAGHVKKVSGIYETEAWGVENQPPYLNQALEIETFLSPFQLLDELQLIENQLGRVRKNKWESRSMDIDILFFSDLIIKTDRLTVPHPRMHRRNFALVPMMEIAPLWTHPLFGKTMEDLFFQSIDTAEVKLLDNAFAG